MLMSKIEISNNIPVLAFENTISYDVLLYHLLHEISYVKNVGSHVFVAVLEIPCI